MNQSLFEQFRRAQRAVETVATAGDGLKSCTRTALFRYDVGLLCAATQWAWRGGRTGAIRPTVVPCAICSGLFGQLRERNGFIIDWENPSAQLYLHQHDYLLDYLRQCPAVIDEQWRSRSRFRTFQGELRLYRSGPKPQLTTYLKTYAAERNVPEDDVPERSVPGNHSLNAQPKTLRRRAI